MHHVKIKNFEPFEPKIRLEDIEDKLEKYGWTEDQKSNFGVNLSHHGLLLTKKDCNLIDSHAFKNNNVEKYNGIIEGMKMKDKVNANSSDNTGLLIGFCYLPKRKGYEYVLDNREEGAREGSPLNKAQKMKGKTAYFYIFRDCKKYKLTNKWKRFLKGQTEKLEKIFGEGLIEDVVGNKIIYKYVIHYREYVRIDDVPKLSQRFKSRGWSSGIIQYGLYLTNEECNQISKLAGVL